MSLCHLHVPTYCSSHAERLCYIYEVGKVSLHFHDQVYHGRIRRITLKIKKSPRQVGLIFYKCSFSCYLEQNVNRKALQKRRIFRSLYLSSLSWLQPLRHEIQAQALAFCTNLLVFRIMKRIYFSKLFSLTRQH